MPSYFTCHNVDMASPLPSFHGHDTTVQAPRVKCAFYHKETESDYEEPT